jgi:uncharacterized GH25 family protein
MCSQKCRQSTVNVALRRAALIYLACFVSAVQAHDFWIEPESFRPAVHQKVPVRLYVGVDFQGDSAPFIPERFERYIFVGPEGEKSVSGVPGDDPAGAVTPPAPGRYIIGLHTRPAEVSFDTAEEFEKYLVKEGLERQLALHNRRKKLFKTVHETYFRCAKSLLVSGKPDETVGDKALGFPLELVAETDPYRSQRLRLRLLYQGQPLEGALLIAFNKTEPLAKLKARTDKAGRAEFDLPQRGIWLVTSVHMIPAPLLSGYDWKSLWASLTFERP